MTNFVTAAISDISTLIVAGIGTAAAVYVASVWWRTKALVPTLTSIVLAAVVVWAAGNVDILEDRIEADSQGWMGNSQ